MKRYHVFTNGNLAGQPSVLMPIEWQGAFDTPVEARQKAEEVTKTTLKPCVVLAIVGETTVSTTWEQLRGGE